MFLGCAAAAALATLRESQDLVTPAVAGAETPPQPGARVQLVWDGKGPLRAAELTPHTDYLFFYPFESTPCFLLDLAKPVTAAAVTFRGGAYAWPGGAGRQGSIVAYAAICPHTYTHPTPDAAMIHYFRPDQPATVAQRGGVITCCVHGSAFDPTHGAVPLQPPAEIPLAALLLEWDPASDALHAVGVAGRPVFEEFFRSFPRLGRRPVEGATPVWELARYTRAVLPC
jgi:arsenite oxidase small subunit